MSEIERKAEIAKNILRADEELNGFALIRENIILQWEQSTSSDEKGRENCYRMLHALNELERYLHSLIDAGKIEAYRKMNNE